MWQESYLPVRRNIERKSTVDSWNLEPSVTRNSCYLPSLVLFNLVMIFGETLIKIMCAFHSSFLEFPFPVHAVTSIWAALGKPGKSWVQVCLEPSQNITNSPSNIRKWFEPKSCSWSYGLILGRDRSLENNFFYLWWATRTKLVITVNIRILVISFLGIWYELWQWATWFYFTSGHILSHFNTINWTTVHYKFLGVK